LGVFGSTGGTTVVAIEIYFFLVTLAFGWGVFVC
jgi:hypothetical protein